MQSSNRFYQVLQSFNLSFVLHDFIVVIDINFANFPSMLVFRLYAVLVWVRLSYIIEFQFIFELEKPGVFSLINVLSKHHSNILKLARFESKRAQKILMSQDRWLEGQKIRLLIQILYIDNFIIEPVINSFIISTKLVISASVNGDHISLISVVMILRLLWSEQKQILTFLVHAEILSFILVFPSCKVISLILSPIEIVFRAGVEVLQVRLFLPLVILMCIFRLLNGYIQIRFNLLMVE